MRIGDMTTKTEPTTVHICDVTRAVTVKAWLCDECAEKRRERGFDVAAGRVVEQRCDDCPKARSEFEAADGSVLFTPTLGSMAPANDVRPRAPKRPRLAPVHSPMAELWDEPKRRGT